MNIETIDGRIKELRIELAVLRTGHDEMIATYNQQQQQLQTRVAENQNKFQQLTGAIAELEQLKQKLDGEKDD